MIALYSVSLACLLAAVVVFLRRSEFGILILAIEAPFILGLCLYPLLFENGLVIPGQEGASYLSQNNPPGWMAAAHIFLYALFSLIGCIFALSMPFNKPNMIARTLARVGDPIPIWRFLVVFGLVVYGSFMLIVGPEVALINAFLGRSGDFSGFGDSAKYLFLKTLGSISMFAVCFIPFVIRQRRGRVVFLLLYLALVVIAYLNSISRNLILYQLVVPLLMMIHGMGLTKRSLLVMLTTILPLAFLAIFFGKPLGFLISIFVLDGNVTELEAYQGEDGLWNSFLRNFEPYWFSVDAGTSMFSRAGPTLPTDALMALAGFIPSRVLESLDLGKLYYGNADVQMACVNSIQFGLVNCTAPPFFTGTSAYVAPLVGAAVAGFFKFFVFGRLEKTWRHYDRLARERTWVPYCLILLFSAYLSFVPSNIALATFTIVVVVGWLGVRAVFGRVFRSATATDPGAKPRRA